MILLLGCGLASVLSANALFGAPRLSDDLASSRLRIDRCDAPETDRRDAPETDPCDASDTDPWVTSLRDRTLNFNGLAAYAVRRHGPPTAFDRAVTDDFDGANFGIVTLSFGEELALTVETFPPEASVVSLAHVSGFADEDEIRELVRTYVTGIGLQIDWAAPDVTREGDTRVETFSDADSGLNASAQFRYAGGYLMDVRVVLAL